MLSLRVPNLLCLEKSEYTPQDTCLVPQAILSVVQSLKGALLKLPQQWDIKIKIKDNT